MAVNSEKKYRILLIGLTALPMGYMERQLGNMAIFIPMTQILHDAFPNSEIRTSVQVSDEIAQELDITMLPYKSLYAPTPSAGLIALWGFLRAFLWFILSKVGIKIEALVSDDRMKEFKDADIVVDFSGDVFGDNGHPLHLLKHSLDLMTARMFDTPIIMMAQSPGPFLMRFRKVFGDNVLPKINAITTRDTWSTVLLKESNIRDLHVMQAACPSFLLKPDAPEVGQRLLAEDGIEFPPGRPLVGFTLCGWNLIHDRYRMDRTESEIAPYVEIIRHIINDLGGTVLLIPHVYRTDENNKFIPGPDSALSEQVYDAIQKDDPEAGKYLFFYRGLYPVEKIKSIIGLMDIHVSGRIHSGVGALSQAVPSVLLAYAYKHYGFAGLVGQERYVSDNFGGKIKVDEIKEMIREVLENRDAIHAEISAKLPKVHEAARLNAELARALADGLRHPEDMAKFRGNILEEPDRVHYDEVMKSIEEIPEIY